ncbi:MAG TPA: NmrA family transcriptional regulator, partial [Rhodanobacteraceae bacterium]|nr:NmrA family transcriptional regulator [Rhodanobacteraceae bacterium]
IQQSWDGCRIVELESDHRISPNEAAATFAKVLGHAVKAQIVPRETWANLFKSQGMKDPQPRIRMLDGFNEGWIEFESDVSDIVKGKTKLETVLRGLVARAA